MANEVKISQLPVATTISGADILPIVQGGVTKQVSGSVLSSLNRMVSTSGLVACWDMNGIPEYPTGTATYFQDAWATVDGWTVNAGCTIAVGGGNLLIIQTASNFGIQKGSLNYAGKTYRGKITYDSRVTDILYFDGTSYVTANPRKVGDYWIFDVLAATSNGTAYLRVTTSILSSFPTWAVDWIYIGDGSYAANSLLDNSGNANHGQIFGATPIDGVSGKALSFDGVNDYVVTTNQVQVGSTFSFSAFVNSLATPADNLMILGIGAAGSGRITIRRDSGSTTLTLATHAGGSARATLITGFFTNATVVHIGVVITWATGAYYVYKNGVLFASGTLTGGATDVPVSALLYLGNQSTLTGSNTWNGTIDEPRIYNRALSAEEVRQLYYNGQCPDGLTKSVTAVPLSYAIRDTNGFLANCDPISITTSGSIGYQPVLDVAISGSLTMPAGSGSYYWNILTYGATIGGNKFGLNAAATTVSGTASANLTVLLKRIL